MSNVYSHTKTTSNCASFVPQHISRFTVEPPSTLHQFKRPQEVLRAIRDAVTANKNNYMSTGTIHGGINVDTISIGAPPNAPHAQGFLIQPSRRTDDATFKSFRSLSDALFRKQKFPLDYLDDLESFYYVVAWMCYAYDGVVGGQHHYIPEHQRALALTCWAAHPTTRESILEKEGMLFGTGIMYLQSPVSRFWGGDIMQELLDNLHYIVGSRYKEKTDLGRPRTITELRSNASEDYRAFTESINMALFEWERRG